MIHKYTILRTLVLGISLVMIGSCSHKYNSDDLDLTFYQWNMWPEDSSATQAPSSKLEAPSCGWEDFNRGVGKLVRIPATFESHFSEEENGGVLWFHCRFTLPKHWDSRSIYLAFEGAGPDVTVFLNEKLVDSNRRTEAPFELDISEQVFYVRDNHLAIRVIDPDPGSNSAAFGILGKVLVKSILKEDTQPN